MRQFLILFFAALSILAFAQPALAQTNTNAQCSTLQQQFQNAGGGDIVGALPSYCSTGTIYQKILNILYYIAGIVAVLAIIYGGFLYMTARGNAEQAKRGRTVLTWAIIGLAVVILAAVIVNLVIKFLVENR